MKRFFLSSIIFLCLTVFSSAQEKPVIGISSGFSGGKSVLLNAYCRSVAKAGGIPVILPLAEDAELASDLVSRIDGLVMSGGEDINPERYGEKPVNKTVVVNPVRDSSDFLLIDAATKRGIPILGICRGEQAINVFFGGTLVQDIPSQVSTPIRHKQIEPGVKGTHMVKFEKGSLLESLLCRDSMMVNSFHHQAVKTVAPGFRIVARANDGVIEAYESEQRDPVILCVQFHPEKCIYGGDDTFLPLFKYFIEKAGNKK